MSDGGIMKRVFTVIGLALAVICAGGVGLLAQAEKAPGTVVLKGSPLGGVKFDHAVHVKSAGSQCEACHHPSKPEKALATPHQRCQACHTSPAAAPMKTRAQLAFHDGPAKKGVCVDCHLKATGKVPLKCNECHKKENV
jgi:hypothetical protein